jgi:transposase-like protein
MARFTHYDKEFKARAVKMARADGDSAAAKRLGVKLVTLIAWRLKADKEDGIFQDRRPEPFTSDEKAVVSRYASEVNWGSMSFAELGAKMTEASGIPRTNKSANALMHKMGLRVTRRAKAEDAVYQPFESVEERDVYFRGIEDEDRWQCPQCVENMFAGLIDRMVARYEAGCEELTAVPQKQSVAA